MSVYHHKILAYRNERDVDKKLELKRWASDKLKYNGESLLFIDWMATVFFFMNLSKTSCDRETRQPLDAKY